jgi:hypothetical protein
VFEKVLGGVLGKKAALFEKMLVEDSENSQKKG